MFFSCFPIILLGFSSTFSAAEESIVPVASPGHIKKKYEVSSQASPFYIYKIFSNGILGKQLVIIRVPQRKTTRGETSSNQDS